MGKAIESDSNLCKGNQYLNFRKSLKAPPNTNNLNVHIVLIIDYIFRGGGGGVSQWKIVKNYLDVFLIFP